MLSAQAFDSSGLCTQVYEAVSGLTSAKRAGALPSKAEGGGGRTQGPSHEGRQEGCAAVEAVGRQQEGAQATTALPR
jgi:hypothetical protein